MVKISLFLFVYFSQTVKCEIVECLKFALKVLVHVPSERSKLTLLNQKHLTLI